WLIVVICCCASTTGSAAGADAFCGAVNARCNSKFKMQNANTATPAYMCILVLPFAFCMLHYTLSIWRQVCPQAFERAPHELVGIAHAIIEFLGRLRGNGFGRPTPLVKQRR